VAIVASRAVEIRRLIAALADPKSRTGAVLRLRALGSRVVPHVDEDLGRLDAATRHALIEILKGVQTLDGKALRKRLMRADGGAVAAAPEPSENAASTTAGNADTEAKALEDLRRLPPPRADERAAVSRERGEAHLALARVGSRLARKDLLATLTILDAGRLRLYCEAAGLVGDAAFLAPLARVADASPEAGYAISRIAKREKITSRSKSVAALDAPSRVAVARALAKR
jgi:hypothetical protein